MTTTMVGPEVTKPDGSPRQNGSRNVIGRLHGERTRWIGFALVLLVIAAAVIGLRLVLATPPVHRAAVSVGHPASAMPASPTIESAWGIRFTNVIVLADNGGVELRYQVIDLGKAARIHLGDLTSNELPTILVDGTHQKVTPSSVLMHFHHGDAVDGQSYSIVYGNPAGAVRTGEHVTIVMKDGAKLSHAEVSD